MTRRVAAAILAVDGFTGLPITGFGLQIKSGDGAVPVLKEEGYRIFWENGERCRYFQIEAQGFYSEFISIDIKKLQELRLPIRAVYLIPHKNYPFPRKIRWLKETRGVPRLEETAAKAKGTMPVFEHLGASFSEKKKVSVIPWKGTEGVIGFKGCGEAAGLPPREIMLSVPRGLVMTGRILYLRPTNEEGEDGIFVTILEAREREEIFLLKDPPKRRWTAKEAVVSLTYRAMEEAWGFSIPLLETVEGRTGS